MTTPHWTVYVRLHGEDGCKSGIWIYDEHYRTVVDSGEMDVWPLSDTHKRILEFAHNLAEAAADAAEFLRNNTPIYPGSELANEIMAIADALGRTKEDRP